MKSIMESVGVWIRHNTAFVTSIVLCIFILAWCLGCESTTQSLVDPARKVTRAELALEAKQQGGKIERGLAQTITDLNLRAAQINRDIEAAKLEASDDAETLQALTAIKVADLDKQDAIKQKALEIGSVFAQGGTVDPVGVAFTLAGLLGIGAIVDNRRKDGIIVGQKMINGTGS